MHIRYIELRKRYIKALALSNSRQVKTNGYQKRKCLQCGYSLEAALSNVNDSFTLSRLMKQPKTVCDPARAYIFS